jgi:hypothetical protein
MTKIDESTVTAAETIKAMYTWILFLGLGVVEMRYSEQ